MGGWEWNERAAVGGGEVGEATVRTRAPPDLTLSVCVRLSPACIGIPLHHAGDPQPCARVFLLHTQIHTHAHAHARSHTGDTAISCCQTWTVCLTVSICRCLLHASLSSAHRSPSSPLPLRRRLSLPGPAASNGDQGIAAQGRLWHHDHRPTLHARGGRGDPQALQGAGMWRRR